MSLNGAGENKVDFQFDVAIIEEAGQLAHPAILGALGFTKRFILVGDEKQLPPLVLSKEAASTGLAESLFSTLKQLDDDYMKFGDQGISACVPLKVQYRMNKQISHFASTEFYGDQLIPHASVANRLLEGAMPASLIEVPAATRVVDAHYPSICLDLSTGDETSKLSTT